MKRPVIPIPAGSEPMCYVGRDFEAFVAEQLRKYPKLCTARLLGYLLSMLSVGIAELVGVETAARFIHETLLQVRFLESIEGWRTTAEGTVVCDREQCPDDDDPHSSN